VGFSLLIVARSIIYIVNQRRQSSWPSSLLSSRQHCWRWRRIFHTII